MSSARCCPGGGGGGGGGGVVGTVGKWRGGGQVEETGCCRETHGRSGPGRAPAACSRAPGCAAARAWLPGRPPEPCVCMRVLRESGRRLEGSEQAEPGRARQQRKRATDAAAFTPGLCALQPAPTCHIRPGSMPGDVTYETAPRACDHGRWSCVCVATVSIATDHPRTGRPPGPGPRTYVSCSSTAILISLSSARRARKMSWM
jgi:hypothetical protein